jgi:hypothetical protein
MYVDNGSKSNHGRPRVRGIITLQARQADGSWHTRNAFPDQNKLVIAGTMKREDLIELAMSAARKWHATHDTPCELRVHDTAAAQALETSKAAPVSIAATGMKVNASNTKVMPIEKQAA